MKQSACVSAPCAACAPSTQPLLAGTDRLSSARSVNAGLIALIWRLSAVGGVDGEFKHIYLRAANFSRRDERIINRIP
jgi:hypothetical protein